MSRSTRPSFVQLWARPTLLALVGVILGAIALYYEWLLLALTFVAFSLFMAWWTSPLHRGAHTPWLSALEKRAPNHAVIVYSPVDRRSSQIQVGFAASDSRITWVNYLQDAEAAAFVAQHGGYTALPVALVGEKVLSHASAGEILDTLSR